MVRLSLSSISQYHDNIILLPNWPSVCMYVCVCVCVCVCVHMCVCNVTMKYTVLSRIMARRGIYSFAATFHRLFELQLFAFI